MRAGLIRLTRFNLAIEMLFISGLGEDGINDTRIYVSISQSRCFSFQAKDLRLIAASLNGFNLAIEMLFISGQQWEVQEEVDDAVFQSRNRDAFHFSSTRTRN